MSDDYAFNSKRNKRKDKKKERKKHPYRLGGAARVREDNKQYNNRIQQYF